MYHNIPQEMRAYNQWIVWRLEDIGAKKPTKVPYSPRTGKHADVTDASTWSSYEDAVASLWGASYSGIGFVFTDKDPFTGIDLDDPYEQKEDGTFVHGNPETVMNTQKLIYEQFGSYTEYSPSGKGVHIITKGAVPSGRRRTSVEVYSKERYFTMTGNVLSNVPIVDKNALLQVLWAEMAKGAEQVNYYEGDMVEAMEDDAVLELAMKAANGGKFTDLFNGQWQSFYSSQSEADFALIDIIAHYTKHRMQIVRLFHKSGLNNRDKAHRSDYLTHMVNKSFDRMLPPIDFSNIINEVEEALAAKLHDTVFHVPAPMATPEQAAPVEAAPVNYSQDTTAAPSTGKPAFFPFNIDPLAWKTPPTGIMHKITEFIYRQSNRPVYEISIVGALGLMAGICGRSYNVSGTGLNHYILSLASTGSGKEAIAAGIDKLINAVVPRFPAADDVLGPADIASGQALLKHMSAKAVPCFVTVTGEFGLKMKQISSANANSADIALRRVLLDLFNKSGSGVSVRPTIYSDKANNTEVMHSPAFSMLGESVPERFYEALDESMIYEGLLPRFIIVEYDGKRVKNNEQAWLIKPSEQLISSMEQLLMITADQAQRNTVIPVQVADAEARTLLRNLDEYADWQINTGTADVIKQLWNRFHVKVMKMAALLAVSDNIKQPSISVAHIHWSASLIITDINRLCDKFVNGEIGEENGDRQAIETVRKIIGQYLSTSFAELKGCRREIHDKKHVQRSYVQQRALSTKAFKGQGGTQKFNNVIASMISNGHLTRVTHTQLSEYTKFTGETYAPLDAKYFLS